MPKVKQSGQSRSLTDLKWVGLSILMLVATAVCVFVIFAKNEEPPLEAFFPKDAPLHLSGDEESKR